MEKDIGKINKNDTSDIIIRIDDFGGRRGLTIREFVTSERYTGFTKAGVRILGSDFRKFKEMINSVDEDEINSEPVEKMEDSEAPKKSFSKSTSPQKKPFKSQEELPDY